MTFQIDAIFDAMSSGEWLTLDEILEKANLEITKEKLMRILDFLCVHEFVDIDAVFGKAKLAENVVKFLKSL